MTNEETPVIEPSALSEEQREEIKKVYDYHDDRDEINRYYQGSLADLRVRNILVKLFGKSMFEKGENNE